MTEARVKHTTPGATRAHRTAGTKSTSSAKRPSSRTRAAPASTRRGGSMRRSVVGARYLVIVESPTKARTVGRILGSDYDVRASVGHVRDLPKSTLGVDVENGFAPKYIVPREKQHVVNELKQAARNASAVYLATDP